MKRKIKHLFAILLAVILLSNLLCIPAMAIPISVNELYAAYSGRTVSVTGKTTDDMHAAAVLLYRGDTLLRLQTVGVTNGSFTAAINITLSAGTYTVKAANYDGGSYTTATFTVSGTAGDFSTGSGTSTTLQPVTTTETVTEGSVTTKTVTTTLTDTSGNTVTQTAATSTDASTNKVNFSAVIQTSGTSASIPLDILGSAFRADTASVTVITNRGEITFDKATLEGMADKVDGDLMASIEKRDFEKLPDRIKEASGDSVVFELKITSDSGEIVEFSGAVTVTIAIPGEFYGKNVRMYHIAPDGTAIEIEGKLVIKNRVRYFQFETNHFSFYALQAVETLPFTDVNKTDWWFDSIYYVYSNGLFSGINNTRFAPKGDMTRAMLVTVLYRLEGMPTVNAENTFDDVASDHWYTDAVTWANANNIVAGYGNGKFGTADNITREQMAVILYRYANYKGYEITSTSELGKYNDTADIHSWALTAMKWANAEGLVTGTTAEILAPADNASRGQVAAILMRFIKNIVRSSAHIKPE
jgi:hypothetical protein